MSLVRIQLRHDRSVDWLPSTILAPGEVGVETDTGKLKVGDGVRTWVNLPYSGVSDLSGLADVATSGSYQDLSDKPTLGTAAASSAGDFATQQQGALADSAVQPGDLADVATSGSYQDLSDKPTSLPIAPHSHVKSDIDDLASSDLDLGGYKCLFANVYATEADLPSATDYHGLFVHVHDYQGQGGAALYAHAGGWVRLQDHGQSGGSPVQSVNNQTGNVTISASSLPGFQDQVFLSIEPGEGIEISQLAAGDPALISMAEPDEIPGTPAPIGPGPDPETDPVDEPPPSDPVPQDPEDPESPPVAVRQAVISADWEDILVADFGVLTAAQSSGFDSPSYQWQYEDPADQVWLDLPADSGLSDLGASLRIAKLPKFSGWNFRVIVRDASDPADPGEVSNEIMLTVAGILIESQPTGPVEIWEGEPSPDVSSLLRVRASNLRGVARFQWQLSRLPDEQELLQFATGLRRGQLYLNLPGGTSSSLGLETAESSIGYSSLVSPDVGDFIELTDEQGVRFRRMHARCRVDNDVDAFTLTPQVDGETVYTDPVEVRVYKPLPDFTLHPDLSSIENGAASFTAESEYPATYTWIWNYRIDADGTQQRDRMVPIPASFLTAGITSGADGAAVYTATLSGLDGTFSGVRVALRLSAGGRVKESRRGQITGLAPVVGGPPVVSSGSPLLLVGQEFRVEKTFSHTGQVFVQFQTRPNDSSEWEQLPGAVYTDPDNETFSTPLLTADLSLEGTQYRFYMSGQGSVSQGGGTSAYTAPLTLTVRDPADGSTGLDGAVVPYGNAYEASVSGPLLGGVSTVDHYATVLVEYMIKQADGTFTEAGGGYFVAPLNGQRVTGYSPRNGRSLSGISRYPAGAFGASSYEFSVTPVDRPLRVTVLASTADPFAGADVGSGQGSVWTLSNSVHEAFPAAHEGEDRVALPDLSIERYLLDGNGFFSNPTQETLDRWAADGRSVVSLSQLAANAKSPTGFVQVASAIVEPEPPRAISFRLRQTNPATGEQLPVLTYIPEHYFYVGAADRDGTIVAAPRDHWNFHLPQVNASLFYLYSPDEGESWATRQFVDSSGRSFGRISVRQVFRWNYKFYVAYQDTGTDSSIKLLRSQDGFTWEQWQHNGGPLRFSSATQFSVANGWLLASPGAGGTTLSGWHPTEGAFAQNRGTGPRTLGFGRYDRDTGMPLAYQFGMGINGGTLNYSSVGTYYVELSDIKYVNGQYVSLTGFTASDPRGIWVRHPAHSVEETWPYITSVSEVSVVQGLGSYAIRFVRGRIDTGDRWWQDEQVDGGYYELVGAGQLGQIGQRIHGMTSALTQNDQRSWALPRALGPQVGRFLYGQVFDASSNTLHIAKLDAYNPSRFRLIRTIDDTLLMPGINYFRSRDSFSGDQQVVVTSRDSWDPRQVGDFMHLGGYVYGPTAEADDVFGSLGVDVSSQLAYKYLDGQDCPEYSDTIYTRNKVLKFFRPDLRGLNRDFFSDYLGNSFTIPRPDRRGMV